MSENQGRRIRRSSVRGFHSGSDHCNRFCFPVRRDLLNGSSRFESNKKSVRIFRNFFNHNLWMCSSNANFSFSILIGWLGPCVGGQFFFYSVISSTEKWRGFILKMGGDAYDRFWKIIKQEPDYFSVFFTFESTHLPSPVATRDRRERLGRPRSGRRKRIRI